MNIESQMRDIKAVFFDLDNTLYDLNQYNSDAFNIISKLLYVETGVDQNKAFEKLKEIKKNSMSNGRNLNELVSDLGIEIPNGFESEDDYVAHLVADGHGFNPESLMPYHGAIGALKKLKEKGLKLGVITDGRAITQKRKVEALKITCLFDTIVYSAELENGHINKSNSKLPYLTALSNAGIAEGQNAMMVGDNPLTDFHFANKLGMITVRVMTEEYSTLIPVLNRQNPHYTIDNLMDLMKILK